MRSRLIMAGAAVSIWLGQAAGAEEFRPGGYLSFEGVLGIADISPEVGLFSFDATQPATAVSQFNYQNGLPRNRSVFGFGVAAGWDMEAASGLRYRFGVSHGVLSGRSSADDLPLYAAVLSLPDPGSPSNPVLGEIFICTFPQSCATFSGEVEREYRETMLQLFAGMDDGRGGTWWAGLEPFWGSIEETGMNYAERSSGGSVLLNSALTSDLQGAMLTLRREGALSDGWGYSLSLGLGRYEGDANSSISGSRNGGATTGAVTDMMSFDGMRARLGAGLDYRLSDNLTLGFTGSVDFWSDQPYLWMNWVHSGNCSPSLCEPPRRDGAFDIRTEEHISYSVGVSLTFRM